MSTPPPADPASTDDPSAASGEGADDLTGPGADGRSAVTRGARRRRRHKGRTTLQVLGVITLTMVLVVGLGVAYLYRDLNGSLNVSGAQNALTNRPEKVKVEGPRDPINILVMGSDSRAGANNIDGNGKTEGLSDTTILLHLSADRKRAYGISIPRDSMVDRPACPKTKDYPGSPAAAYQMWNAAFAVGGSACTMQQFEQLTGIQLDHNIVVDFDGFKDMVDAIGGVHMCIPDDMVDNSYTRTTIKAGKNRLLNGVESRTYVRMRHITNEAGERIGDGSDISRTRRQQAFIGAMAKQVLSAGTLANPIRLANFLKAAMRSLQVDPGLGNVVKLADLGLQFKDIGLDDIQFLTIPNYYPPEDPNRVRWLEPAASEVWKAILHDKPIPRRLLTGVIKAGSAATGEGGKASGTASDGSSGAPSGDTTPSSPKTVKNALPETQYDDPARNGLCS